MEFLVESSNTFSNIITESKDSAQKQYRVKGIGIQTEVVNHNKRIYPINTVGKEINRYIEENLKRNRAVGELNHPLTNPNINPERISHKFEKIYQEGNNWIVEAVIANHTPMGSVVAGLMDVGVELGISTRAVGSTRLNEKNIKVVQDDFQLISAGDIVYDPSAPDAYLTNLMENREWVWANGVLVEQEKEIKNLVNTAARRKQLETEGGVRRLFEHILSRI